MNDIDKQIQRIGVEVKSQLTLSQRNQKSKQIVAKLIETTTYEASVILDKILTIMESAQGQMLYDLPSKDLCDVIRDQQEKISSFPMLMILYGAWRKKMRLSSYRLNWKDIYMKIMQKYLMEDFNRWINIQCSSQIFVSRQLLKKVIIFFPSFLQQEYIEAGQRQFDSVLIWLSLFEVKDNKEYLYACGLVKVIKQIKSVSLNDYEQKEHLLIKRTIQLLAQQGKQKGNLYLFFEPFTIREKDIQYFCHIYEGFLQDLDETHICRVFLSLTRQGINKQILGLIKKITHVLKSNEQYFTIRIIYQKCILPVLAAQLKTHRKWGEQIFNLVLVYVAGFLKHCNIGDEGVECLIMNLELVQNQKLKQMWADLILLVCQTNYQLRNRVKIKLEKLGLTGARQNQLREYLVKQNYIWNVTLRNGRKHKKYPEIQSARYRGIGNRQNQCYIISTVQALFLTSLFPKLIKKYSKEIRQSKLKVIGQFWFLFQELQTKKDKITVNYLKKDGPQLFVNSKNQEDAQQYLLALFDAIQGDLKMLKSIPTVFEQFQKIFKIQYISTISCKSCGFEKQKDQRQSTYVHSFRSNEHFQLKTQECLTGYNCSKCGQSNCEKREQIVNNPDIMILHINRFSHQKGVTKKNLGNKPIKRQFDNYRLAGFISHRGSNITSGHYIFYGRIQAGRWAIFNDGSVKQFSVGEQQQFEREFRAQNTPYILFYRKQL